jgi:hypothetical protein
MMNRKLILVALFSLLAFGSHSAQGQNSNPPYRELRLPKGKHFPVSKKAMLDFRDRADSDAVAKMRAHAWDLFSGLMQAETPEGKPIWESWYTLCDVGLLDCGKVYTEKDRNLHPMLRSLEVPVQFLDQISGLAAIKANPNAAVSNSDPFAQLLLQLANDVRKRPQLASVLFDKQAAARITKDCLHPQAPTSATTASRACSPKLAGPSTIRDFSRRSVVLKTVWAGVSREDPKLWLKKPSLWNSIPKDLTNVDLADVPIPIDISSDAPQCHEGDYASGEAVPLSCFYSIQVSAEDVAELQKMPNLSDVIGAGVAQDDYLVLVAVHVTTKEIPDWVWATFWWDTQSGRDSHAAERPDNFGVKWKHFLMETTLSATTPKEADEGPKICFNPFLESRIMPPPKFAPTGIISNCLQCHSKAAYVPPFAHADTANGYDEGILARDGKTLASSGLHPDPHYFDNRVKTDFLWTISDALTPKVQEIRTQLKLVFQNLEEQRLKQLRNVPPPPKQ